MSPSTPSPLRRVPNPIRIVLAAALALFLVALVVLDGVPTGASAAPAPAGGAAAPATRAGGTPSITVTPGAEIRWNEEKDHARFVCPKDQVMVERRYNWIPKDHPYYWSSVTYYRCATVQVDGVTASVTDYVDTKTVTDLEYGPDDLVCPANTVMVGRAHEMPGSGKHTELHVCARLSVDGQSIVPGEVARSPRMQERTNSGGSQFQAPRGAVFVGRWYGYWPKSGDTWQFQKEYNTGGVEYLYAPLVLGGAPTPEPSTFDVTHDSMSAVWTPPKDVEAPEWDVSLDGAAPTKTTGPEFAATGLTPNTKHTIAIRTLADGLTSAPWTRTFQTSTPPRPTAPRNLRIDNRTGTEATLAWDAPTSPAGAKRYAVLVDGQRQGETPTRAYKMTGLAFGVQYAVEIRAINAWLESDPLSASFVATPPPTSPDAPRNLTVTDAEVDKATLQWEPPERDGGAPLTDYSVKVDDADAVVVDAESHRLAGLDTGRHTVEIRARNGVGFSAPLVGEFDTLPTVPTLESVEQVDGSDRVAVRWERVDDITQAVHVVRDGDVVAELAPDETSIEIEGHEYSTTYEYSVRAVGASGSSESPTMSVTPRANAFAAVELPAVTLSRDKAVQVRTAMESTVGTVTSFEGTVVFQAPQGLEFAAQNSINGAVRASSSGKWVQDDALTLTDVTIGKAKRKITATFSSAVDLPVGAQLSWLPKLVVTDGQGPGDLELTWSVQGGETNLGPVSLTGAAALVVPAYAAPPKPVITGVEEAGGHAQVYWGGSVSHVDHFQVYRDGVLLRDRIAPTESNVDIAPHAPDTQYAFKVVAVGRGGSTGSDVERITTEALPETGPVELEPRASSEAPTVRVGSEWRPSRDAPGVTVQPATPDSQVTVNNPVAGIADGSDDSVPVHVPVLLGSGLAAVLGGASILGWRRLRLG